MCYLRLFFFCVLVAGSSKAFAATSLEVAVADNFCRRADYLAQHKQSKMRYFGNLASMRVESRDDWREFGSAKEREKAATDDNLFETADVTLRDGKVLAVKFMFSSPSGDWAHYVDACYRPDGTLARAVTDLRTFNGNMRVVRTIYFSSQGQERKRQTEYFDLNTGKKVKNPSSFLDQQPSLFMRTALLPFYGLL